MDKIGRAVNFLADICEGKERQLMTHIVAGYPSMEKCQELALGMSKVGVDFIEIQIPFSDPVADGPTIMGANQAALDAGVRVEDCFELMKSLNEKSDTPLLFMSYFNILFKYGVKEFCQRAKECGCYGLIVPDMPLDEEEYEGYLAACKESDLKAIQVVSPLTPQRRLEKIAEVAEGFVYCVARYGVTGSGNADYAGLGDYLKRVREVIGLPLAVGFGISNKKATQQVWDHAEIAVIGSAVITLLG